MRQIHPDSNGGIAAQQQQPGGVFPVSNATKPYWRSQLHPIDSHRTTPDLPSECDVAIIGAGMSGAALAYHLTNDFPAAPKETPPSIVILEAREVCSGATGRNGGHVKMKTDTMLNIIKRDGLDAAMEVRELVHDQIYALKEVVEKERLECEFELRRSFDVFLDESEAEKARVEFEGCRREGQSWTREVQWMGGEFVKQVTSMKGAKGAFSSPACSLWPYKFVSQLLATIISKTLINLQTHTPVTTITTSPSHPSSSLIHTSRGTLNAKNLIFATNAYTSGILPTYTDKIIPTLGTASHLTPSPKPISPHMSNTYNITYAPARVDYLNPRPDGGIVVGGGKWTYAHDRGRYYNVWDDSVQLEEAREHFEGLMQRHFLGWEGSGSQVESVWTGVMGYTVDEWPHVGEVVSETGSESGDADGEKRPKQWIMAGFNGGGMAMIFLTAKGLARMVRDEKTFEETGLPRVFETTKERLELKSETIVPEVR